MIRDFQPNKNVPIAGLNFRRTIDLNDKIWSYSRRYQSSAYVRNLLRKSITTNADKIVAKAQQISSLMVQSENYFKSARTSAAEIKPLLIYYGMVGLSKCLILSGDNPYTLSAIDPENFNHGVHGLTFAANSSSANDATIRDSNRISAEFCYVRTQRTRVGLYNLLRSCYSDTVVANDTRFTVQELLSLVPEIYKEYYSYYNSKPRTWHCNAHLGIEVVDDTKQLIEFRDWDALIQKRANEQFPVTLSRCFPELSMLYTQEPNNLKKYRLNQQAISIDDYIYVSDLITLEQYALMKINGYTFSDLDVHFMLMFILSNLVRYRQDKWSRLIRRADNTEIFLIETFIEISLIKYPLLILRELDNINYMFTGSVATYG